ncbi:MAG: glycosyltransferase [Candidatus Omnitrophica bacterium]|nr:glycosyltransferase [Candidatus Omnitrophota bacterium]
MNILQILPELESGGVETGTVDLACALAQKGHAAFVISAGGRLVEKLTRSRVRHICLPVHKKSLLSVLSCARKVRAIIRREKIDIVHARSRVPAWIAFFACRGTKAAFITTCHGYYSEHFFSRIMGWGKIVIVISQIIGRHMINDFHVQKEKIRLIYRGVDLNLFPFRGKPAMEEPDKKLIGIVGRIVPLKGHIHFIKSLPTILHEFPGAKALIIGGAPQERRDYYQEVTRLVEGLNLADKVEFLGTVDDVAAALRRLDVLVMSTTTEEAFGRVIIEAGAVGVPVVATKVGGVVEIIEHEEDGLLVEPAQPFELAQAVIRLFRNKPLSERCVHNLRKKVEAQFSLSSLVNKTIAVYNEALRNKQLLVIKFGAFGDVILIGPSLKALRGRFPDAHISVMVRDEYKDVLQMCPYIDDIIIFKKKGLPGCLKHISELRRKRFDIAVDFQNNNISHVLAFAAGIAERYGYVNKKMGFLLNKGIFDRSAGDPVTHQFRILEQLGIEPANKRLEMWISAHDRGYVDDFLKENWHSDNQPLIGINALASRRWQTKVWSADSYARVADAVAGQFNARVVFTGTQGDAAIIDRIISRTRCRPINAAGRTSPLQLAALIERCAVLLTIDSAPMHMAAALGTPFVAMFGPTDPKRHLPYAQKCVLICKDLKCAPCYSPKCFRKNCMREITVEEVMLAMRSLLGEKVHKN